MKRLISKLLPRLLPRDARENILGDLEESGYRLRDVLTAILASWIAHHRREWSGPVPRPALTSEAALQRRIVQLQRPPLARPLQLCATAALILRTQAKMVGIPALGIALLLGFGLWLFLAWWVPPYRSPLERYRILLQDHASSGFIFWSMIWLLEQLFHSAWSVVDVAIVIGLVLAIHRYRRIRRELKAIR